METLIKFVIWCVMLAASSAQTSVERILFSPSEINIGSGPITVIVSCEIVIDGNDGVHYIAINYGRENDLALDEARQFRCKAGSGGPIPFFPADKEFTSTQAVDLNGCHGLSIASEKFTTQVATLSVAIPISTLNNSRFWVGVSYNGSTTVGPVSKMDIVAWPSPDVPTRTMAIGVVVAVWLLLKLEWVLLCALCWGKFRAWETRLPRSSKVWFYVLCFTGGVSIPYLYSKCSRPLEHVSSPIIQIGRVY